jgi:hypothetical protein
MVLALVLARAHAMVLAHCLARTTHMVLALDMARTTHLVLALGMARAANLVLAMPMARAYLMVLAHKPGSRMTFGSRSALGSRTLNLGIRTLQAAILESLGRLAPSNVPLRNGTQNPVVRSSLTTRRNAHDPIVVRVPIVCVVTLPARALHDVDVRRRRSTLGSRVDVRGIRRAREASLPSLP